MNKTRPLLLTGLLAAVAAAAYAYWTRSARIPMEAEVVATTGAVQLNGAAAAAGQRFAAENARIVVGADGVASLRLDDGSLMQVAPGSDLRIVTARRSEKTDRSRTELRLDAGEIVRNIPRREGFSTRSRLSTPAMEIGVRGTEFIAGTGRDGTSRVSTLHGQVALDAQSGPDRDLTDNYGTVAQPGKAIEAPSVLPPPPALLLPAPGAEARQPAIEFRWQPQAGATGYVFELALDAAFGQLVLRQRTATPSLNVAALPYDHPYHWRVATLDSRGLQGRGAEGRVLHYRANYQLILEAADANRTDAAALEGVERAVRSYPKDPELLRRVGWLHYVAAHYPQARDYYDRALAVEPGDAQTLIQRGRVLYWLKDYPAAAADYRAVLRASPDDPDALWGLGAALFAQGQADEAAQAVDRALVLAPEHPYASHTGALIAMKRGQRDRALALMQRHLALQPADSEARRTLDSWRAP